LFPFIRLHKQLFILQELGVSNLERHTRRCHPTLHTEIEWPKRSLREAAASESPKKRKKTDSSSLHGTFAIGGRPFSLIDEEGMQDIIKPLVSAMDEVGRKATISSDDSRSGQGGTAGEGKDPERVPRSLTLHKTGWGVSSGKGLPRDQCPVRR